MSVYLVRGKYVTQLPPGQLVTNTVNKPIKTEKKKGKKVDPKKSVKR